MNSIDPFIKDIMVFNASGGVHGLGRGGILIGNPTKGYYYYSKGGTTENHAAFGPSNKDVHTGKG